MRKIIIWTRITMDGVLQSPSGPEEEDQLNEFKWGGWTRHYWDEVMTSNFDKIMSTPFDLLLGRNTYDVFVSYWPYKSGAVGETFNRINKYVVATTPVDLSWKNSFQIDKDVVNELKKLKEQDGPDLLMFGSSRLIQTLLANHLVDVLHLWVFPITLGKGQKLFEEGTQAQQWKLTGSEVSTTGAVFMSYALDGEVTLDPYVPNEESEAALARRKKWDREKVNQG
jgi:dihydrofolate reductase